MRYEKISLDKNTNLYFIGDFHIGNLQHASKELKQAFKIIKEDEQGKMIGMGDYIDAITFQDKRYNPFSKSILVGEQWDKLFSMFDEVKEKIVGLLVGNHEIKYFKKTEHNIVKDYCEANKIKYLGFASYLHVTFPFTKKYLNIFVSHGRSNSILISTKMLALDRATKGKFENLDAVIMGHTHELVVRSIVKLLEKNGKPVEKIIWTGYSGSFLKNYEKNVTGYGELGLYDPLPVGMLKMEIRKGRIEKVYPIVL